MTSQTRTIAKSISDTIRRQMRTVFRQLTASRSFSVVLVVCLAVGFGASTTFAQKKKNVTRPSRTKKTVSKPVADTRTTAQPEIRLERFPPDPAVESADISITAHLRARSLIFETVPTPTVEFSGNPDRDTVWEAQRENLPTPVQPGVTYRDIGIRLKITSVFRDIDRIVAEALGEISVTEDKAREASAKPASNTKAAAPDSNPATITPPRRERK